MESSVSPSRAKVGKIISEQFSTLPEKVKIKKITGKFGSNNFQINVSIYNSEEEKNRIEKKRKKDSLHIPIKGKMGESDTKIKEDNNDKKEDVGTNTSNIDKVDANKK